MPTATHASLPNESAAGALVVQVPWQPIWIGDAASLAERCLHKIIGATEPSEMGVGKPCAKLCETDECDVSVCQNELCSQNMCGEYCAKSKCGAGRTVKEQSGGVMLKPTFLMSGTARVANNNADSEPRLRTEVLSKSKLSSSKESTQRLRKYFSQSNNFSHSSFVGKEGQGGSKTLTPTKRKLLQQQQVTKLVQVFDNYREKSDFRPGESGILCSPAKRSRLECGVNNPTAN